MIRPPFNSNNAGHDHPCTQRKPATAAAIADLPHIFGYASGAVTVIE